MDTDNYFGSSTTVEPMSSEKIIEYIEQAREEMGDFRRKAAKDLQYPVWLNHVEPKLFRSLMDSDPYAIWVTKLDGLDVVKIPARMMAYMNVNSTKVAVVYPNGDRECVRVEQMSKRG